MKGGGSHSDFDIAQTSSMSGCYVKVSSAFRAVLFIHMHPIIHSPECSGGHIAGIFFIASILCDRVPVFCRYL